MRPDGFEDILNKELASLRETLAAGHRKELTALKAENRRLRSEIDSLHEEHPSGYAKHVTFEISEPHSNSLKSTKDLAVGMDAHSGDLRRVASGDGCQSSEDFPVSPFRSKDQDAAGQDRPPSLSALHSGPSGSDRDLVFKVHPDLKILSIDKSTRNLRTRATSKDNFNLHKAPVEHAVYRRSIAEVMIETEAVEADMDPWERKSIVCTQRFMMSPSSGKHLCWELIGLALIIYDLIVIPLDIVFEPDEDSWIRLVYWLGRIFWLLDVFKSFFTGHILSSGIVELRFPRVARRYLLRWFCMDAMCVIVDWASVHSESRSVSGSVRGGIRSIRILRVVKLIRLFKAPEIGKFVAEHIRSDMTMWFLGIVSNLSVLVFLGHVIACFWYWVGNGMLSRRHSKSWVEEYIGDRTELDSLTIADKYAWSLHWSLAHMTGEILYSPTNPTERGFAIAVLIFCFLTSVMFSAGITTSMTRLMMVAGKSSAELALLRRYLFDNNISTSLSVRMQRNGNHCLAELQQHVPEANIALLTMISEPLRRELHFELYSPMLFRHPFFEQCGQLNMAGMGMLCHVAVQTMTFSPGDVVYNDCNHALGGEAGNGMLWVMRGRLIYQPGGTHEDVESTILEKGDWSSEAVLWTDSWIHCGTLRAKDTATILSLNATEFRKVMAASPITELGTYATNFVKELNLGREDSLTDLSDFIVDKSLSEAFPEYGAMRHQDWRSTASGRSSTTFSPKWGPSLSGSRVSRSVRGSVLQLPNIFRPTLHGRQSSPISDAKVSPSTSESTQVQVQPATVDATLRKENAADAGHSSQANGADYPSIGIINAAPLVDRGEEYGFSDTQADCEVLSVGSSVKSSSRTL